MIKGISLDILGTSSAQFLARPLAVTVRTLVNRIWCIWLARLNIYHLLAFSEQLNDICLIWQEDNLFNSGNADFRLKGSSYSVSSNFGYFKFNSCSLFLHFIKTTRTLCLEITLLLQFVLFTDSIVRLSLQFYPLFNRLQISWAIT